jgi:hypothetical protein
MEKHVSPSAGSGVPKTFLHKFGDRMIGCISGFDRIRFQGTLRLLFKPNSMEAYLATCGVLIKHFRSFAEGITNRVKALAFKNAEAKGRPVQYLSKHDISKEDLAREIARKDGISAGLIGLFTAVEPCWSYSVRGDRQTKEVHLQLELRKCTHLYHYFMHPDFGLMHVRVQSWFPFTVQVCLNGREWLARQMDAAGIQYEQQDNCFTRLSDPEQAQALLDQQLHTDWKVVLNSFLKEAHPLHEELGRPFHQEYYWSANQTEFATDLMFKDATTLAKLYPQFVHHAIRSFASPDVLRFLGRAKPNAFRGEVCSTLKHRPEGVRVRHTLNGNSLKTYDKQGSILRVETTIVHPEQFKVYRPAEGDPDGKLKWQKVRRGVADLWRRAEVSRAANSRYLNALASVTGTVPLKTEAALVSQAVKIENKRYRPLNPWAPQDGALLEAVSRGEFMINGFRNRDIRALLYPRKATPEQERKRSSCISRRFALLRAHELIRKVNGTHRWVITDKGRRIITALLSARQADVDQLTKMAA